MCVCLLNGTGERVAPYTKVWITTAVLIVKVDFFAMHFESLVRPENYFIYALHLPFVPDQMGLTKAEKKNRIKYTLDFKPN